MGKPIASDTVLSLIFFAIVIIGIFSIFSTTLIESERTVDEELGDDFKNFQNSLGSLTQNISESANDAPKGTFETISDFFSKGISIVTTTLTVPSVFLSALTFISTSFGFNLLPTTIIVLLSSAVIVLIVFAIVSAYLRNQT